MTSMSHANQGLLGFCFSRRNRAVLMVAPLLFTYGCATSSKKAEVHQFAPLPSVQVGARELQPVSMRPVAELVREAEAAYLAANAAQERGDSAEATRQYTIMLDRMVEAGLDPHLFRADNKEFAKLVESDRYQQRNFHGRGEEHASAASGIRIPFPLPERVLIEIEEIQTRYPSNFQIGLDRSQRYAPYIKEELRKAGLPEQLIWICMVESQFAEKIDSRSGAGGMWQFMPPTARRYNLRLDSHVDERYNWQSATQSAIVMLKDLHKYFDGDWSLAISAYNMGEGGLSRAMASNGGMRDFWTLIETPPASDTIKRETKKYYPRFLATLIVASNPERYGFKTNPASPAQLASVPVQGMYSLGDLDRAMGQPVGTLAKYNPDLIQEVTPPGGNYPVRVPANLHREFTAALGKVGQTSTQLASRQESSPSSVSAGAKTHRVKRGDTISKIATRYGVSQSDLMRLNNVRSPRDLPVGKSLKIPGGAAPAEQLAVGGPSKAPEHQPTRTASSYRVKRGDTLFAIARDNRVPMEDLLAWNNLSKSDSLKVGQELKLYPQADAVAAVYEAPAAPAPKAPAQAAAAEHVVRAGEFPAKIARDYGMELNDFLALNSLSKDTTIHVGQKVKVKGTQTASASDPAPAKESLGSVHRVRSGETASSIAAQYGVSASEVLAANGLTARSILRVGQELRIGGKASGDSAPTQLAKAASQKHVVAQGHNPTSIARRYGVKVSDLYQWNQWSNNHILRVGDEVLILK